MDQDYVQRVTEILEYIERMGRSPDAQTFQSARDLITSLDQWDFFSQNEYWLQVRALQALQRLAYYDVDRGAVADLANWNLERWLGLLRQYPRSVPALQGKPHCLKLDLMC